MYCLWPLQCLLLVCTTLVCVLFVATPTYTISVYYFSMCTVCGHSHVYYEFAHTLVCVLFAWPLPPLLYAVFMYTLLLFTFSVPLEPGGVLFVATSMFTISV